MLCKCSQNDTIDIIGLCDVSDIDVISDRAWTEINIPEVHRIPPGKPDIKSIEKIYINAEIVSKRIVETPDCCGIENNEGLTITGKKLMTEGLIFEKIIYTADEISAPVHTAHFSTPFSAWIIVDSSADSPEEYCIETCVEDVYVNLVSERKFYESITLLLNARKIKDCPYVY